MSAVGALPESRIIRGDSLLPARVEQVLRKMKVDKLTGNVILNIKEGRILGFHKTEIETIPAAEI